MMVLSVFRPSKVETPHRAQARRSLFRSSSSSLKPLTLTPSTSSSLLFFSSPPAHSEDVVCEDEPNLRELNGSLKALAAIFPDVRPEVFREMLQSFGEESRLHVVAEQLLRHKAKWVQGRWRVPLKDNAVGTVSAGQCSVARTGGPARGVARREEELVPMEEQFRSAGYKRAARGALYHEFRGLSGSTVDAVLAEHNHSYTFARPTLVDIAAKSWRFSISTFFLRRKRSTDVGLEKHPMVLWQRGDGGDTVPVLKETGCKELDDELYETLLLPLFRHRSEEQEAQDREVAMQLNEEEAEQAEALYECECCFSDTTFERMATCNPGGHTICFRCIRHAVSEALFGQGWGRNIDHERGQIKCLAPMTEEGCEGCISQALVKRAVEEDKGGDEAWRKLEERITEDALLKSQIKLVRCPFCAYAEVDDIYFPPASRSWRVRRRNFTPLLLTAILLLTTIPSLLILILLSAPLTLLFRSTLTTSLKTLARTRRTSKFTCFNPLCSRPSCLHCTKPWRDIHTCLEPAHATSLRTTVEAARTAALKRTCPRCSLSFIKSSGCNKLTCVCGYQMCYVCRKGLNGPGGEGEGYRHFCEHFRGNGGRCTECEKCDLYKGEDEDGVVRRAGERAEREWREREGMVGVVGLGKGQGTGGGAGWWDSVGWGFQDVVDAVVERLIE